MHEVRNGVWSRYILGGRVMTREELSRLPIGKVQELYHAYNLIIACIEVIAGGPYNVGSNGEYWSAVNRRNMCRQVYNERIAKDNGHGDRQ